MTRIAIVGGAGAMGAHAAQLASHLDPVTHIRLIDIDTDGARRLASTLSTATDVHAVDITDHQRLLESFDNIDVALNCAGPFFRFGTPVLTAAIEARVHYLDICDDWEPTLDLLDLADDATTAGITAIVGIGASPGVTNLLCELACQRLHEVRHIVTGWIESEEGLVDDAGAGAGDGKPSAALVHWLHQLTGTIRVLRNGEFVDAPPLQEMVLLTPDHGPQTVWSVGHPEAVTLARRHDGLDTCINVMATTRNIVDQLHEILAPIETGASIEEAARTLLARTGEPFDEPIAVELPGLFAHVSGRITPRAAGVAFATLPELPEGGMAGATSAPLVTALHLLIDGEIAGPGVFAPEDVIRPEPFFERFRLHLPNRSTPVISTLTSRLDAIGFNE